MSEDDYWTVRAMREHGGSFVEALAGAFARADPQNFAKLKTAFPEYWEKYNELGKGLAIRSREMEGDV